MGLCFKDDQILFLGVGYPLYYKLAKYFLAIMVGIFFVSGSAIYFLMAVPNVIGLYLLAPVVRREMRSYFDRLARGEIRPTREAPEHLIGSP